MLARGPVERALLVVKRSTVSQASEPRTEGTSRVRQLLEEEDTSVADLRASHHEHTASLEQVRAVLAARGIRFTEQSELPTTKVEGMDLVVVVGGDGMVLGVSHAVRDETPVLGVNSAPSFSVGYLSGCTAAGLTETLDEFESGQLRPLEVQRLQLEVGGRRIAEPVLNDILFCADNPAMMSRYMLIWPDGYEVQRSSGVWVSTPAGSTSALTSAGGPILPLTARQFAFLVREPYAPPGSSVRYRSAVLSEQQELEIECRTLEASVFVDGTHRRHPLPFGERLRVKLHPQPLRLVRRIR
ncbi:MAG: NAD(+)/NADH kinase [Myxococcota bacterium]